MAIFGPVPLLPHTHFVHNCTTRLVVKLLEVPAKQEGPNTGLSEQPMGYRHLPFHYCLQNMHSHSAEPDFLTW
jgi:hypothetical protein